MAAAGGKVMEKESPGLQYLIREHMIENAPNKEEIMGLNNGILGVEEQLHLRWNSQKGTIFVDGSHLTHSLELGDEVLINANAPPLALFTQDDL
jgi:NAD+ kinase